MLVCIVWGISVIADSAQFSASVTELSVPEHLGTMLTIQTSSGFLLSMITIHLVPVVANWVGWQLAFAVLAPGPVVGIWAMGKLRASADARRLAGGRG
jgi:dipeptide/tripeptide permease